LTLGRPAPSIVGMEAMTRGVGGEGNVNRQEIVITRGGLDTRKGDTRLSSRPATPEPSGEAGEAEALTSRGGIARTVAAGIS
jgi:hypothetical protein